MRERLGMVMWCRAVGGDGWAHLPPSSWSKIELEEEEQRRKGCPRECALRAHAPSRAGWWPPVDNVRARVARRGVVSRVEHVVCGGCRVAGLRARIARSLPSALWQGRAERCHTHQPQQRMRVSKDKWQDDLHRWRIIECLTGGHKGPISGHFSCTWCLA